MRIVFIGSVVFSEITLKTLLSLNVNIVGIITKEESNFNSDFVNLNEIALKHNIPCKYVNDINHANNISWIENLNPDIIFCFGWSNLLKKQLLNFAPMGVIGYHPSLLPFNKGRHPIIWAKVLGLEKTGSTFFFMNEKADAGEILSQAEVSIMFEDDAMDIYNKINDISIIQIKEFLPKLISKTHQKTPQQGEGNIWRKRNKDDGKIDFRMTTKSIINLIRGLTRPYPGAHCFFENQEIIIWKAVPGTFNCENIEPGKVISVLNNKIEVKTGDSSILFVEHNFDKIPNAGSYLF